MKAGKVHIPSSIHLDDREIQAIKEWSERTTFYWERKEVEEEECCPSSPFTFHIYAGGLGDTSVIKVFDKIDGLGDSYYHHFSYGIDDDNELYTSYDYVREKGYII